MRILLTNDDGIHAPGIEALYEAFTDRQSARGGPIAEELWPVAPLTVQSATGHGITFHTPLMVSKQQVSPTMSGLAVDGRPADCVKLAICSLWPERFGKGQRPDLVVSGLNAGANIGINVIYSGTVAAALEAAFLGVPAVAFSLLLGRGKTRFDVAAAQARRVLELLMKSGPPGPPARHQPKTDPDVGGPGAPGPQLGPHACVSVNIPVCEGERPWEREPPIVVCPMNTHGMIDAFERRVSPGGEVYYWSAGGAMEFRGADAGTDVEQIMLGRITVTPLLYDLTRRDQIETWRKALAGATASRA